MDNLNISLIKCRKCNGPHLTIKCAKVNEQNTKTSISVTTKKAMNIKTETSYERTDFKYQKKTEKSYEKTEFNYEKTAYIPKKIYKIKISNLPIDITQYEILYLIKNWGHITNVNVKNYNNSSIAVLEFKFEDEMEYFIDALDSTPFEYQIISIVKLINSY